MTEKKKEQIALIATSAEKILIVNLEYGTSKRKVSISLL